ncbi:MAG: hypothetical protein P8X77_03560 [Maritimibacter sp.]|jgi:flagellar biosynthesis/type III secretory pathway chaperone
MGLFSMASVVSLLEDLLETERSAIMAGEIGSFQRFAQDKERLLQRLARTDVEPDELKRVQRKAERNQELLVAAARGLKAATARLEMIAKRGSNQDQGSLRTYGRDGASSNLVRNRSDMNHRA